MMRLFSRGIMRLVLLVILTAFPVFFTTPVLLSPVYAACGVSPEIGCKYYYGEDETCQVIWGGRHTCYPMLGKVLCGCDDCQGPRGDRCGGKPADDDPSPTPLISAPPGDVSPSPFIPFMGIKLGKIAPNQTFNIIWDFLRNIIGLWGK